MGSKSRIAAELIKLFPNASNFYDLFGGGFSITHAMLVHRKKDYQSFYFNEIRPGVSELINDAINGKYNYSCFKPEFISRERFFKEKESNAYINICWSFGNNGHTYIYGADIEKEKESFHNAVVFNQFDEIARNLLEINSFYFDSIKERRLFVRRKLQNYNNKHKEGYQLQSLHSLERLHSLESLESLERLERLEKPVFLNTSFEQVFIKPNSVIYCDPPYFKTGEYDKNKHFNLSLFYEWAIKQTEPLFISEYNLVLPGFSLVWEKEINSTLNAKSNSKKAIERVYANKAALIAMNSEPNQLSLF